jgi:hypothetical protein
VAVLPAQGTAVTARATSWRWRAVAKEAAAVRWSRMEVRDRAGRMVERR